MKTPWYRDPVFAFIGGVVATVLLMIARDLQTEWRSPSEPKLLERAASTDPMVENLRSAGTIVAICPQRHGYIIYRFGDELWINAKTTAGVVAMRVVDAETACKL